MKLLILEIKLLETWNCRNSVGGDKRKFVKKFFKKL